ncbi:MAG: transporter substrate-binding domain-containing protein [Erysipelotrichaceae bacterium]|nr:transporter substrate-binding domain-containing protein [Erysipelotrichaceae bacterium]
MKKLLVVLLSLLMLTNLCACGSKTEDTNNTGTDDEPAWVYEGVGYDKLMETMGKSEIDLSNADGTLAKVLEKGELVMATSPDYPPAEFVDALTGEVKGSDILLGQYIANSLGVTLKVESMDFGAVLTSLDTGKSDIAISGFGYKEDRAEVYELSIGYQAKSSAAHHTILVRAEDVDKYNSLADFAGKTIDAQANSLQQMYVEDQLTESNLQLVSTLDIALLELSSKKVDAVALDSTTAKNHAENSNGMFVSLYSEKGIEFDLSQYKDVAGNVVACKKGETSLINAVNEIITDIMEKGTYADMYYAACDAAGVVPSEE